MELKIIKQLRDKTGAGILECQKVLKESNNDLDKAVELLRKRGEKIIEKRREKSTNEGIIGFYIHANNKIGVLVELVCESDFVARNNEFKELAHDLAMQIAATNPTWLSSKDVPKEIIKKEKEIAMENIDKSKPEQVRDKIITGKIEKFYTQACLLEQKNKRFN